MEPDGSEHCTGTQTERGRTVDVLKSEGAGGAKEKERLIRILQNIFKKIYESLH